MKAPTNLEKAIAAGLLYGLKIEQVSKGSFANDPDNVSDVRLTVHNISTFIGKKLPYRVKSHKPILFKLEALTRPITINGETFTPIIELAKIIGFDTSGHSLKTENDTIVMVSKETHHTAMMWSFNFFDVDIDSDFGFSYGRITVINGVETISYYPFKNQSVLFEKLDEWHINRHNLTPDQFIDAETVNVY